jgi:antitoxin ParD1/3/4
MSQPAPLPRTKKIDAPSRVSRPNSMRACEHLPANFQALPSGLFKATSSRRTSQSALRWSAMATRNVVSTEHQEKLIEGLVSSGRYQNASEVLREGLRLIESRRAEDRARLKALRAAARAGIADVGAGRVRGLGSIPELRSHLDTLAQRTVVRARAR